MARRGAVAPVSEGGFSADWLSLRREADARARSPRLAAALADQVSGTAQLTILDLGAGSGNNMTLTAPGLALRQHWLLADSDEQLLSRARPPEGVSAEPVPADLAHDLEALLARGPDLVTASALLDLAGAAWIERLADGLCRHRLPFYGVLSVTGADLWLPAHPLDVVVAEAFAADQARDKGLGPALGAGAPGALTRALRARGATVADAPSDWQLDAARDGALIAALADGTAEAVAPAIGADAAARWAEARRRANAVRIGHVDQLALPPA